MPRTKREKILVILTLGMLLAGLAYTRLEKSDLFSGLSQTREETARLRDQYAKYEGTLRRERSIQQRFEEIAGQYGRDPSLTPEKHSSEQINALCLALGFQGRQIDTPTIEDIPDVIEYGLIKLSVRIAGEFDKVVRFLNETDKAGYLINDLTIQAATDSPVLAVQLVVARPVKLSELRSYRPDARGRSR